MKKNEDSCTKPEILTVAEVSSYLRIHRTSVMRKVVEGELRCYTLGKRRLFRRSDVEEFFENQVALESVLGKEV
ncbi:MAG: helix-turn-helix domain-containing protein [Desulfobulbaceae bacterium]|nr:helix-turn-helix domain-containing protein [Desulfobulbaceae bacterium]